MHQVLDKIERDQTQAVAEPTSILREKILRSVRLSESELDNAAFDEAWQLIFRQITSREFLRRMVVIAGLVDLDQE